MLIKITNKCSLGCSHCMNDSIPYGSHMTEDIFIKALEIHNKYDSSRMLIISGGEPFEHPDIFKFLQKAKESKPLIIRVFSNGSFLDDDVVLNRVIELGVQVNITNVKEFYPKALQKIITNNNFIYCYGIRDLRPQGRALINSLVSTLQDPYCVHLKDYANRYDNFEKLLRERLDVCVPSITPEGLVVMSDSNDCYCIGDINSSGDDFLNNIKKCNCNKCYQYIK